MISLQVVLLEANEDIRKEERSMKRIILAGRKCTHLVPLMKELIFPFKKIKSYPRLEEDLDLLEALGLFDIVLDFQNNLDVAQAILGSFLSYLPHVGFERLEPGLFLKSLLNNWVNVLKPLSSTDPLHQLWKIFNIGGKLMKTKKLKPGEFNSKLPGNRQPFYASCK